MSWTIIIMIECCLGFFYGDGIAVYGTALGGPGCLLWGWVGSVNELLNGEWRWLLGGGGRRQCRRPRDNASTCFVLLDWASSCFALAGSVFFILGDSAVGDGDGIAVYGTTRLKGCFLLCKGSEL